MDTFAIKDTWNVQRLNVKDYLMFLFQTTTKEQRFQLMLKNTALVCNNKWLYTFLYKKFIIFCKLYINRFHYFCLRVVENSAPCLSSYFSFEWSIILHIYSMVTIIKKKQLNVCCYIHQRCHEFFLTSRSQICILCKGLLSFDLKMKFDYIKKTTH